MKRPKGVFGIGVSFGEMELAAKQANIPGMVDPQYGALIISAAVEKLRCIREWTKDRKVRGIIDRHEWLPGDKPCPKS